MTETPDILDQDLTLTGLTTGQHRRAAELCGIDVGGLEDYVAVVEACFERFAPRAVALKTQWAYLRPLRVAAADAPPKSAFRRLQRGQEDLRDRRAVEDYLFRTCLELASDYQLPVKVHTGFLGGINHAQLEGVFSSVLDMTPLVQEFPRTTFVFLHMAWPQQEQLLALCKHQPNVVVELSWAWSAAPMSTVAFVERFLTSVPATKLLCFGGDTGMVENVVGAAELARRGLSLALGHLVRSEWLSEKQALGLVPLLMRENAKRLLPSRSA